MVFSAIFFQNGSNSLHVEVLMANVAVQSPLGVYIKNYKKSGSISYILVKVKSMYTCTKSYISNSILKFFSVTFSLY